MESKSLTEKFDRTYQNLFEYSTTPTALFDLNGKSLLANRVFSIQVGLEQTAFTRGAVSLFDLFDKKEEGFALVDQIEVRGVIRRREVNLITSDGDVFTVLLSGRTLPFDEGDCLEISFINIAHLKELQRTLRREHTRLASLIENLAAGVFLVNRKDRIVEANMTLGNLLRLDPEELLSQSYLKLFGHMISRVSAPEIVQQELSQAVLSVIKRPVVEFTFSEQEPIYFELTLFPVRDEFGQVLGWGGLLQDQTELRIQASWKLELLSILSHDIRSPLATLKGHATALLASHMQWSPAMITEFLEAINRGVDQLTHQVDRNLALTRVETGRLGLRPEGVKPKLLVEQALERVAGAIINHEFDVVIPDSLPNIRVDPGRVEEVLVNLVENAIRYAPTSAPIRIHVRGSENWVRFTVMDHGPGIPSEKQRDIFEKYVRLENEGGGTGLGLYISRTIVEAHGGRMWVQSPPEGEPQGAAFIFTLPVMPDVLEENLPNQDTKLPPASQPAEETGRILVVEDQADYQALLRAILLEGGYQVEIASDGQLALDILQISQPDLILLDWVMPGISGVQVCRSIRRWSQVPIIMLTSKSSQEDLITAFDSGVDDYITKPYKREELLARMQALLRRGEPSKSEDQPERFSTNGLLVDFETREVWVRGKKATLTATEFDLLAYLIRHPRQVLTYDQLINAIWSGGEGTRHALSVHLSRLRKKVERDPKDPVLIGTRWGVGYMFKS